MTSNDFLNRLAGNTQFRQIVTALSPMTTSYYYHGYYDNRAVEVIVSH